MISEGGGGAIYLGTLLVHGQAHGQSRAGNSATMGGSPSSLGADSSACSNSKIEVAFKKLKSHSSDRSAQLLALRARVGANALTSSGNLLQDREILADMINEQNSTMTTGGQKDKDKAVKAMEREAALLWAARGHPV